MAGLRDLFEYSAGAGGTINYDTLYVYNASKTTPSNGGSCCLWTVPAGVTWFAVELWGGGGGGAGTCCCIQGWPGGSGSYARKIISGLSGGEEYTICAAGSTCCAQFQCLGVAGYPSFVSINGGAVQVCASGGTCGRAACYHGSNCSYQGCAQQQCGSYTGTMGICGVTGSSKGSSFCYQSAWQYMPSAPFTPGGSRGTMSECVNCHGCAIGGYAHWPGGGGASSHSHSSTWSGAFGAGGLVSIYYGVVS